MWEFTTFLRNFLINILKNENIEELLMDNIFYFLDLTENSILWKQLTQDAASKVNLNKYGFYFRFILLLLDDINLKPEPTAPTKNVML